MRKKKERVKLKNAAFVVKGVLEEKGKVFYLFMEKKEGKGREDDDFF